MNKFHAALFGLFLAVPAPAFALVSQPFLTIDGDGARGGILNYFQFGAPSDVYETTLSGTVTDEIGAPSLVGAGFSLSVSPIDPSINTLMLGASTLTDFNVFESTDQFYDPFLNPGPGDLNLNLSIEPDFIETPLPGGGTEFVYQGGFSEFPPKNSAGASDPRFDIQIAIFLNSPVPIKTFFEEDGMGNMIPVGEYYEGPLDIDRITISTIGGEPIPTVPLPAGLPLLAGALGMLWLRRFMT